MYNFSQIFSTLFQLKISFSPIFIFRFSLSAYGIQRGGGFTQAGVSQRFVRAINFQIPTKLSAGIHPRLRETARCAIALYSFFSFFDFCNLSKLTITGTNLLNSFLFFSSDLSNNLPCSISKIKPSSNVKLSFKITS